MDEITVTTPPPQLTIVERGDYKARCAFNAAFALAQGMFEPLVKNRHVVIKPRESTAYEFRFADLQEIHAKTRPGLSANGLSTTGQMIPMEGGVSLALILAHTEGFERVSEVFCAYGEDIKQFGGRLSYMRRYMLQNLLDVAADDDLDEGGDDTKDRSPAPAPKPRPTPARKSATAPAQGDGPPPGHPAYQEPVEPAEPAQSPAVEPPDNPAAGATEVASDATPAEEDTGELAEPGACAFLLKRAKQRGANMVTVLAELGLTRLNATTLYGCTLAEWEKIKTKV